MPAFEVFFEKEFSVVVDAESSEEAEAAAHQSIEDGDIDCEWDTPEWEVVNVVECDRDPEMGIGAESTLVDISDAVPASEREPLVCGD